MVLPTCPFPNLLWLSHYDQSEGVWLDGQENYTKQTWRNRFDIRGVNRIQGLSLHVIGTGGTKTGIQEIRLEDGPWKREHIQSVRSAYGSAPFAVHYLEEITDLIDDAQGSLFAFNLRTIEWCLRHLNLTPIQGITETFSPPDPRGMRAKFKPGKWELTLPEYEQMFLEKRGFESNLSAVDLLMNLGPEATLYLKKLKEVVPVSP